MADRNDDDSRRGEWRARLLIDVSTALAESSDYEAAPRLIAEFAVPALADWCTVTVRGEDGTMRRIAVVHRDGRLRDAALEYERNYPAEQHRDQALANLVATRRSVVRPSLTDEDLVALAQNEAHLAVLRRLGCTAAIIAPMLARGEVLGVLSFMLSTTERRFTDEDIALAEDLARRAALTLDVARLHRLATRQEEEKRRQTQRRLDLLIDSIKDYAVFMLTPEGNVKTWNPGAERIKGYTANEIIGRHFSTFYSDEDKASGKCEMELREAARTGRFEDEGWRVRKDGSQFWANVVISAVHDETGALIGFSKVTRDLTERKRSEEERAARMAAEQASRAKDEFLAMLGHELRNPLAPIVTALQLMKLRGDGQNDGRGSRELQIIERQVEHMLRLVDDLLDVSRITRGKIELKRRALDVRDVIARAIEIASPLLERRRHHFTVEAPPATLPVDGDEARLAQVFANLLTNAAKYTEPGGHISVHARLRGGQVVVEVRDDGIGISPELLPRVFELFVQGQQGSERAAGGLGIGLGLVRLLVQLHGGEVTAESEGAGCGSTFTVRLPADERARASQAPIARTLPSPLAVGDARRVLVVDDNEDALDLLAEGLRLLGYQVETAANGADALELLPSFRPEIAILDIGLPVMDGYELAERIRAELPGAPPRLIALTGYGQKSDRDRSRRAGFTLHLVKPIDTAKLAEHLRTISDAN